MREETPVELSGPYKPRRIRFIELWEADGWRIKVYGIESPSYEHVMAAKAAARPVLPAPPVTDGRYGVGFLVVSEAAAHEVALLSWWEDEHDLHHRTLVPATSHTFRMSPVKGPGFASVWDLRVVCFERQSWLYAVLGNPTGPDLQGYLLRQLNEDV
jgi:hypothetical protein